ncbi:MAG: hypothetical protein ACRELY_26085, partial [Polyangiaceae bacterium]
PQYAPLAPPAGAPAKYDLVREWVDSTGLVVGTPELIAEYAVDLKLAFTIDNGTYTGAAPLPNLLALAFDDSANQTYAPLTVSATAIPQRIRSVQVRLSTRSPMGDRGGALSTPGNTYQLRYCTKATGCTAGVDSKDWARMRTVTTEVALPNQARLFY